MARGRTGGERGGGVILITAAYRGHGESSRSREGKFHYIAECTYFIGCTPLKTRQCTNVRESANPSEIVVRQINGECF